MRRAREFLRLISVCIFVLTFVTSRNQYDAFGLLERLSFKDHAIDAIAISATTLSVIQAIAVQVSHGDKLWVRVLPNQKDQIGVLNKMAQFCSEKVLSRLSFHLPNIAAISR